LILLASNLAREADAFTGLFATRQWASLACRSVADCRRLASATPPRIAIIRYRLADGCSDDVLTFLQEQLSPDSCHIVVLAPANLSTQDECRQLALGATHVLRDPVRVDVVLQLVSRCHDRHRENHRPDRSPVSHYDFAGVLVFPAERRLARGRREIQTTSKVIELVQLLHHNTGRLVPYTELYEVLFSRRFAGETANCRVLLARVDSVFRQLGVSLRECVQVVPKSGYLYEPDRKCARRTTLGKNHKG
jgi:DNA-binding response OmpR family regulator